MNAVPVWAVVLAGGGGARQARKQKCAAHMAAVGSDWSDFACKVFQTQIAKKIQCWLLTIFCNGVCLSSSSRPLTTG